MENKANYFFVGVFVFGIFIAIVGVIFWLSDSGGEQSWERYEIRTKESVAGLSIKAPVYLLGVEVGAVESVQVLANESLEVSIKIKVKKGTPIRQNSFATLQIQGITGLKYIQLQGGLASSPLLKSNGENLAIIEFKDSFLETLDKQSVRLFSLLNTLDERSKTLLSDENLANFAKILQNLEKLTNNLNESKVIENFANLENNFSLVANNANVALKRLNSGLIKAENSIDSFDNLSKVATQKLQDYDELKFSLMQSLDLLSNLLNSTNLFINKLSKAPLELIFKQSLPRLGPGER